MRHEKAPGSIWNEGLAKVGLVSVASLRVGGGFTSASIRVYNGSVGALIDALTATGKNSD